ncbi:glycosyltransferase family 32 protein [Burkholderia latens]|uniref:glycosyltransferase family 32 protein n=1 Tax=Burkholderia latens TaxID=488446 RepID=UPI001ABA0690|nr:glycosyltransferase [Burkholderia latens]
MRIACLNPKDRSTYSVRIPTQGVKYGEDGRYRIELDHTQRVVAFHVDLQNWFLVEPSNEAPYGHVLTTPVRRTMSGRWERGNADAQEPGTESARHEVHLPDRISVPEHSSPIPRILHFIWIGDAPLPAPLATRVMQNATRCPGFETRLYIETSDAASRSRLIHQFSKAARVALIDLQTDRRFLAFLRTALGRAYRHFASSAGNNFSAASDILRAHLLHRDGGIYLDVDDTISHPVPPDRDLLAGPEDILLNRMVLAKEYEFGGYPSSNFACQPNNPVLAALLDTMTQRLAAAHDFLHQPRPWKSTDGRPTEALLAYVSRIFELVGPKAFNDVLQACRPDYYSIEREMICAYQIATVTPSEPRLVIDQYFNEMHAAKAFYLPFAEPDFDVEIGSAQSWNT